VSVEAVLLSVPEAAEALRVTDRRVHQLVARGALPSSLGVDGLLRVPAAAVEARAAAPRVVGRPWSEGSVWAAAWLLDGREPGWLNARTLRRVRRAVPLLGAAGVRERVAGVVRVTSWRADEGVLAAVEGEPGGPSRRDAAGGLTVCLPGPRADGLPLRFGLAAGADLRVVAVDGFWPFGRDGFVPSSVL
jgi:hypothetical protein